MRIAICDDEASLIEDLKKAVMASSAWDPDATVSGHADGESLLAEHERNPYDIVFLDIEMDGMTGLEAGHKMRSIDKNVIIIYVTSYIKYALDSFKIEPFDYLLKPVDSIKINDVMGRAAKKLREQRFVVDFRWRDKHYALRVFEIVHLESEHRHVTFVTKDNRYMCVGKLGDYERSLSPYGFLRCHQSYMVNMGYIKSINAKTITTSLDYKVLMSARKKQYCLNEFNKYITKHRI